MESEVIAEAGWGSLDLSSQAESEIMEQLLGGIFPSNGKEDHQELPWSVQASHAPFVQCNASSNAYSCTSSNSVGSLTLNAPSEYEGFYLSDSNGPSEYEGFYLSNSTEALRISSCSAALDLKEQGATQFMDSILNPFCGNSESSCEDLVDSSMNLLTSIDISNKRKRQKQGKLEGQTRSRKFSRKSESKQTKKAMQCESKDGSFPVTNKQSLSCYTSVNDTNASQESPVAANLNGKAQASNRSAIDLQSLYARERRERINERLKILQNLVPNGTKVDISTMLEDAVHYVKFLQLQIKLLSSDEMWMYAPIAYNGMNIGIDLNLSQH